eukprot:7000055-Alexandrium_andersonii.AAC.1
MFGERPTNLIRQEHARVATAAAVFAAAHRNAPARHAGSSSFVPVSQVDSSSSEASDPESQSGFEDRS